MLEEMKERVYQANFNLLEYGLVKFTWGNVSAIDRETNLVVIKPSGVKYQGMKVGDMVVVDLKGNIVEGKYRPSSDTPTHLELYKAFPDLGGIVHTHSTYATSWAQARRAIPCYGTTHADYFYGEIPCARSLTKEEIALEYEKNTGKVIIEVFLDTKILEVPGVLCAHHGSFAFGKDAYGAVYNAVVLEECAKMAIFTEEINGDSNPATQELLDKHYQRKHGENAYYGQGNDYKYST